MHANTLGYRIHAGKAQARRNQQDTRYLTTPAPVSPALPPAPALPFQGGQDAPKGRGFYFTFERCALDDGKWRFFIRTRFGTPIASEDTLQAAWDKLTMFNGSQAMTPTPFD